MRRPRQAVTGLAMHVMTWVHGWFLPLQHKALAILRLYASRPAVPCANQLRPALIIMDKRVSQIEAIYLSGRLLFDWRVKHSRCPGEFACC
jgi:hypothetical protein